MLFPSDLHDAAGSDPPEALPIQHFSANPPNGGLTRSDLKPNLSRRPSKFQSAQIGDMGFDVPTASARAGRSEPNPVGLFHERLGPFNQPQRYQTRYQPLSFGILNSAKSR